MALQRGTKSHFRPPLGREVAPGPRLPLHRACPCVAPAAFRAAQICLIGVDAGTLEIWRRLLFASVVFHHSNLALPDEVLQKLYHDNAVKFLAKLGAGFPALTGGAKAA